MKKHLFQMFGGILFCIVILLLYNHSGRMKGAMSELYPAYQMEGTTKKWGYINARGKFVIPPRYDSAEAFMPNGLAKVGINNNIGLINQIDAMIVPPSYDGIGDFHEGIALATRSNHYYGINEKGKAVFNLQSASVDHFSSGLAAFDQKIEVSNTGVYGYLDQKGRIAIKPRFQYAASFHRGIAIVKLEDGSYAGIDTRGRVIYRYHCDWVYDLGDQTMVFQRNNRYGIMSSDGRVLLSSRYDDYSDVGDGLAIVRIGKDYGLTDPKENYLHKMKCGDISPIGGGFFAATRNVEDAYYSDCMKKALFNRYGKRLTDFKYYRLCWVAPHVIAAADDKNTYLIDEKGKILTEFPVMAGSCEINRVGGVYRMSEDEELSYYSMDGKLIWKGDSTMNLGNGIKVRRQQYKPDYFNQCLYPEIIGLPAAVQSSVNRKLKKCFMDDVKYIKEADQEDDCGISAVLYDTPNGDTNSYNSDFSADRNRDLLMITLRGHDFTLYNGKQFVYQDMYFVNMKNGRFYTIKDLFNRNSDYSTILLNIALKMLVKHNHEAVDNPSDYGEKIDADTFKDFWDIDTRNLFIKKDALCIRFTPSDLGLSLSQSDVELNIPYQDIQSILDTKGEFWKSFEKQTEEKG